MHFPTTRVLTVLELLQSRGQISGPELAERLEVDARTIRRYITMLQDLGIPVEAARGRYGTYRLRPGFKLPPLMFTDDEALALTLGLIAARNMNLMATVPATEGALAKVERVLPLALRTRVQAVQETLVFDASAPHSKPDHETLITLCTAAKQRNCVKLCYRAYEAKEETERVIDPYGLVYRSGYWYVVGYCHLRSALRTFRLDRVVEVQIQNESFVRPADFDCLEFVVRSLPQTPNTWFVEVLLNTTLEEAQSLIPPALALLEQVTNGVMLRCYVQRLEWIALELVRLRCPFVVYQPVELRQTLRQLAERVLQLADNQ